MGPAVAEEFGFLCFLECSLVLFLRVIILVVSVSMADSVLEPDSDPDVELLDIVRKKVSEAHKNAVSFLVRQENLVRSDFAGDRLRCMKHEGDVRRLLKERERVKSSAVTTVKAADYDRLKELDEEVPALFRVCFLFIRFLSLRTSHILLFLAGVY